MREISPSASHSCEEFLHLALPEARILAERIREQKLKMERPLPSASLIDNSNILSSTARSALIDKVASLVDENLFGRSEMCKQFSLLLAKSLVKLGFPAKISTGECSYYVNGIEVFKWHHFWVRIDQEVIDANTDIINENPFIPRDLSVAPFWGLIQEVPKDRRLRGKLLNNPPDDEDVKKIWWPELDKWLDSL